MSTYDLNSTTPAGIPLTIGVESDQLVIRIGVDTLAFCFEIGNDNQPYDDDAQDFRRSFKVVDRHAFANGVCVGLRVEEEDGSTPLTRILDAACIRAVEDDMGVEEDGRIVTHEMLHPVAAQTATEQPRIWRDVGIGSIGHQTDIEHVARRAASLYGGKVQYSTDNGETWIDEQAEGK